MLCRSGFCRIFWVAVISAVIGLCVPASAAYVTNGSFEDISGMGRGDYGYLNAGNISGWTISGTLADVPREGFGYFGVTSRLETLNLAGNTRIPDGDYVMFMQLFRENDDRVTVDTATMTTTFTDLIPGETYMLGYYYNVRDWGNQRAKFSSELGGKPFQVSTVATLLRDSNGLGYCFFRDTFVATAETMEFSIMAVKTNPDTGTWDETLLIDNVFITKASEATGWLNKRAWRTDADLGIISGGKYSHAINLGNGAADGVMINDLVFQKQQGTIRRDDANPENANYVVGKDGLYQVTAGYDWTGDNIRNTMTDEGSKLLSHHFLYVLSNITLEGLIPGMPYETTLFTNTFGSEHRYSSFTVNGGTATTLNAHNFSNSADFLDISVGNRYEGGLLTWVGNADADGKMRFDIVNGGDTMHFHAVMNRALPAPDVIMATGFGGLNAAYADAPASMTMDYCNVFEGTRDYNSFWQTAGTVRVTPDGKLEMEPASEMKMAFLSEPYANHKLRLSLDVNLSEADGGTLGVGFFEEGTGDFSGITLGRNSVSFSGAGMNISGNFDTDWVNLMLEFLILPNGTATLTELSLDGAGDYSALYGSVFSSTDLIGFGYGGAGFASLDNFVLTDLGVLEDANVPEPAAWVLLTLGMIGLGIRRKKILFG